MKKITQITLVCLTVSLAFLSSCKKDSTEPTPNPGTPTCSLTKMDMNVFGMTISTVITNNAAGQVIEMYTNDGGDISGSLYTYNASGQVTMIGEYSDASKVIDAKTTYTYGANGVLEEKSYYDNNGTLEVQSIERSEYTGTKLTRKNLFIMNNGQEESDGYMLYFYGTNGDVSNTKTFSDDGSGTFIESGRTTFTYNDKVANKFLLGVMTEDPNFPATHYVTLQKEEEYNDVNQTWETSSETDYTYSFNSNGTPSKVVMLQGLISINFSWDCK